MLPPRCLPKHVWFLLSWPLAGSIAGSGGGTSQGEALRHLNSSWWCPGDRWVNPRPFRRMTPARPPLETWGEVVAPTIRGRGDGRCLDALAWRGQFQARQQGRRGVSQGDQGAVLLSLFSAEHLSATQRCAVELGHNSENLDGGVGSNSAVLMEIGFQSPLLIDGGFENHKINLHKHLMTKENVLTIFEEYQVPLEPDYVSVDIDSCDLWIFLAITTKYRPRVMTVEYNSNYPLGDYTSLRCRELHPFFTYQWGGDNIYGASLSAIALAAQYRGYVPVYVTRGLDVFLVREDLVCNGTAPSLDTFAEDTSFPMHSAYEELRLPRPHEITLDVRECRARRSGQRCEARAGPGDLEPMVEAASILDLRMGELSRDVAKLLLERDALDAKLTKRSLEALLAPAPQPLPPKALEASRQVHVPPSSQRIVPRISATSAAEFLAGIGQGPLKGRQRKTGAGAVYNAGHALLEACTPLPLTARGFSGAASDANVSVVTPKGPITLAWAGGAADWRGGHCDELASGPALGSRPSRRDRILHLEAAIAGDEAVRSYRPTPLRARLEQQARAGTVDVTGKLATAVEYTLDAASLPTATHANALDVPPWASPEPLLLDTTLASRGRGLLTASAHATAALSRSPVTSPHSRVAPTSLRARAPRGDAGVSSPHLFAELAGLVDASVGGGAVAERLVALAAALESRAYDLRPDDVLRAVALIAAGAALVDRPGELLAERAAAAMRAYGRTVALAVVAHTLEAGPRFLADALATLAATHTAQREVVDALLARLLALLRLRARELRPVLVVRITSALAKIAAGGGVAGQALCARGGATPENRVANQRCVVALGEHIQRTLPDFLEEDLEALHEGFVVAYLGRETLGRVLRRVLRRAGELHAGLQPESVGPLAALRRLAAAILARDASLVDTLPEAARRCCGQLLAD